MMKFEWDENKNQENIRKHGVSFELAQQIFKGCTVGRFDIEYHNGEIREVSLGMIGGATILVVVHTDRNNICRLISARQASRKEKNYYDTELQKATYS